MTLALPIARATSDSTPEPRWLTRIWAALGSYGRIGVVLVVLVCVGSRVVVCPGAHRRGGGLRRRCSGRSRVLALLGCVGLGTWALRLPRAARQLLRALAPARARRRRAVAALCFVLGAAALALPLVLDRSRAAASSSFVAARHVRAKERLSHGHQRALDPRRRPELVRALRASSRSWAASAHDLKRKILGNNAHIVDRRHDGRRLRATGDDMLDEVRARARRAARRRRSSRGEAMASSASNTAGVLVRGIDPEHDRHGHRPREQHRGRQVRVPRPPREARRAAARTRSIGIGPGGEPYLQGPGLPAFASDDARSRRSTRPSMPDDVVSRASSSAASSPSAARLRRRRGHAGLAARRARPDGRHAAHAQVPRRRDLLQRHVRVRREATRT